MKRLLLPLLGFLFVGSLHAQTATLPTLDAATGPLVGTDILLCREGEDTVDNKCSVSQLQTAIIDPLTVLGPAAVCADSETYGPAIPLMDTNTAISCSGLYFDVGDLFLAPGMSLSILAGEQVVSPDYPSQGTDISLNASDAAASDTTPGAANGGLIRLVGGDAARLDSGDANGGDIILAPGAGIGTGRSGNVVIASGNLTGPPGGFSIIGGTGASDTLTLDSTSNATNGAVKIAAGNSFRLMLLDTDAGNYESLNFTASAGAFDVRPAQAGTGSDVISLTLAGEGATGTVVLDGSDDVAGSVTVSAAGGVTAANGFVATAGGITTAGGNQYLWYSAGSPNSLIVAQEDTHVALQIRSNTNPTANLQTWTTNANSVLAAIGPSGQLIGKQQVTPDIDGETTTAAQSGTVWTNTGDGDGEAITLLNDPTIGVQYCFAVDVAQTITVAPSTGETLYYGTDQCVASLTSNAIGSTLCVTAITGGSGAKWFTMSHEGSWTCND